MRHQLGKDFEPITIKIHRDDKHALVRRALEAGRGVTYADLVRKAIGMLLNGDAADRRLASTSAALREAKTVPFGYVHRYLRGDSENDDCQSVCGLVGLADRNTTNIAEDVTCPRCKSVSDANRRALEAEAKKTAKKTTKPKQGELYERKHRRASRPPGSSKKKAAKR